jgi:hypothetical protein
MGWVRRRLTYANVMATVAVFIALGAGAYAAGLGRNTVKSKQIKAGAVKTSEIADGAVNSAKVADGSLSAADFADGSFDTPQQLLDKLKQVDGSGSGLDADTVAGISSKAIGTLGATSHAPVCIDDDHASGGQVCATTSITLPRPGPVLLMASGHETAIALNDALGAGSGTDDTSFVAGECGVTVDGGSLVPLQSPNSFIYTQGAETPLSFVDISPSLAAGAHTIQLRCSELDGNIGFDDLNLAAVMIGAS